ncbi:Alpha/Beta hydrolase protein [Fusarium oxysporum Fo47]|uniref:Alpha/Beta hydrolase protein n=1 Tax=Fusarium oxysporum Fo47 TaxID=660027 RepID=UPI002869C6A0|nr:Alpha/Beta hydrolase protein [Fusarium oxysporum Fo47]QKD54498.2 Alpha/Beta hydrolase protein [Fusarium oxysporum Fo47]
MNKSAIWRNAPASPLSRQLYRAQCHRSFACSTYLGREHDPRIKALGREISDDYAIIREKYGAASDPTTPKYPIVLAHGLFGFAELRLSPYFPAVEYWHGIRDALTAQGATVLTPTVPPSSSIADRATALRSALEALAPMPQAVTIVAHSMGGLDTRYMLSHLAPLPVRVAAVVTVATPHRGSAFADYLLDEEVSPLHHYLPQLYQTFEKAGLGTAAFSQLTRRYMAEEFNPSTPDQPDVRYFSYGAAVERPALLSPFRHPHAVMTQAEGPNDGLVSVESSHWGTYKGTLLGVSHLDLINWSNRVGWTVREWMGIKRNFNAIAFYLDIADMLAKEGY